jgi:hypothetical protein
LRHVNSDRVDILGMFRQLGQRHQHRMREQARKRVALDDLTLGAEGLA